ncbi:hypothetical protein [Janibacter anophelis]|uniref:hypothetical protein n=1 Tax=Janibacter anophelis TaxID=319054 RepID=UPI0008332D7B|nr:hypothetical protein [Janibacter anophelis]
MTEQGERREPVVTGLAAVDPLPWMLVGFVGAVVCGVGSLAMEGQASTWLGVGACLSVLLFVYGLVVVAAKVDAIFDMLRDRS